MHKNEFLQKFALYSTEEKCVNVFTVVDIENALLKIKKGKMPGIDRLSAEHLLFAHPSLIVSLKMLFNVMYANGFVPDDFGRGLLIPLLKDSNADVTQCDNYRGITISGVISKLFEYVVLEKYSDYFNTDSLQFGFRKGVGCSDALFTVKSVVNHFTKNGCTVNVSALDISKAFDRVSHYALFSKLMARKFPKHLIKVLMSWYTKTMIKVKWFDSESDFFQTTAGVRQGGILSPFLFAIYIEDVLLALKAQGKGCKVGNTYLGCILYADDILLLSQSVSCMQNMLCICNDVAMLLDLKFNVKKSSVLRIGNRCMAKCSDLRLNGVIVPFVEEIKYLGIYIRKSTKFLRSMSLAKIKFFRCFNSIYSKASRAGEDVLVNLFNSYCLPLLTYACEAIFPTRSELRMLDKLVTTVFNKIFHSFDSSVISYARLCFDICDIEDILRKRNLSFLSRYYSKNFSFVNMIAGLNCCNAFTNL